MARKKVVTKKATRSDDVDEINDEKDLEPKRAKRTFRGELEFYHDLFKLEIALFKKNISPDPKQPNIIQMEHCHIFHSYDSNGKKQTMSSAVGGHKHEIKTFTDKDGALQAECGPAIGGFKNKKTGEEDQHTHKITYQDSVKMKAKKLNAESVKVFSAYDQPIKGDPQ